MDKNLHCRSTDSGQNVKVKIMLVIIQKSIKFALLVFWYIINEQLKSCSTLFTYNIHYYNTKNVNPHFKSLAVTVIITLIMASSI